MELFEKAKKELRDLEQKMQEQALLLNLMQEQVMKVKNDTLEMVPVEGGTFLLGGKLSVTVSTFEIGKYQVTQKQWKEIMGTNPFRFSGDDLPVESVSWNDAQKFIEKLNAMYPGKNYRLPTEAEWEYAAKGGKFSKGYEYAGSNNAKEVGWYWENSDGKTNPVGQLKPNELGIYDMSGNVWEWCQDWFGDYPDEVEKNYAGPEDGKYKVLRGGSWNNNDNYCRSAIRDGFYPDFRNGYYGFRVCRSFLTDQVVQKLLKNREERDMKKSKQNKVLLWLDDLRNPFLNIEGKVPAGDWTIHWVLDYDEFIAYINKFGLPDAISFDHDLGECFTGKDCANSLVEYCIEKDLYLPEYFCHSSNPPGKSNILGLLDNFSTFPRSFDEE